MNHSLKKLTLSGLLAASLFAEITTHTIDIDKTRIAYFAGGVGMLPITMIACGITCMSFVPFGMAAADNPNNKWYHQCAVMLAYAVFCVPAARLLHTNYKLFKRAFSSPAVTQKDPEAQIDEFVCSLPEDQQKQFHKNVEELSQKMSTMSDKEIEALKEEAGIV